MTFLKKEIVQGNYRFAAEIVGAIYLGLFFSALFFLQFYIKPMTSCYIAEFERGSSMACSQSLVGSITYFFFTFLSPMGGAYLLLQAYIDINYVEKNGLLSVLLHWSAFLLYLCVVFCSLFLSIRILKSIINPTAHHLRKKYLIFLSIIALPTILTFFYKTATTLPRSSETLIHTAFWHGEFSVPRKFLEDWSVAKIEKSSIDINDIAKSSKRRFGYLGFQRGKERKLYPSITFSVPIQKLYPEFEGNEFILVDVWPHYSRLDEVTIHSQRQLDFDDMLHSTRSHSSEPVYMNPSELDVNWEVYKKNSDKYSSWPNLYVQKDHKRDIQKLLICVDIVSCEKPRHWNASESYLTLFLPTLRKRDLKCEDVCRDISGGTIDYDISYTFPRSMLEDRPDLDTKIREFVDSFYTPNAKID